MERVIDPILADLQCEYDEALVRGLLWRARLGLIRSYLALGRALFALGIRYGCDPRNGNPGAEVARTWIVSVLALAILTVTFVLPPLFPFLWKLDPLFGVRVSVTLVPQALPLSIPAGLCIGVLWAMRGRAVTWRRLSIVLSIAIAFAAIVWMVLEWMMPQANQGFRELMAARLAVDGHVVRLTPGLNELGLSRLGQRNDPAAIHHYHVLWALCFAAVPLSLLACGLAGYVRRSASAIALAAGLSILYVEWMRVLAEIPSEPHVLPFMQAWVPNIALLLLACVLLWEGRRHRCAPAL
jgi:hypothetical protein